MKTTALIKYFLFLGIALTAQTTLIPDPNFEQALIDLGHDSGKVDGKVVTDSISAIQELDVNNRLISDLTGIEDFVALKRLFCYSNGLTGLDVSKNTALTDLHCYMNQLTRLDVSANIGLEVLFCGSNELTNLNLFKNTALKTLSCYHNKLTSLNLLKNTDLEVLSCWGNKLSKLNVYKNTALTRLNCENNELVNLDISSNIVLTELYCNNNQLTRLNLNNGNNTVLSDFNATGNENLKCIEVSNLKLMTDKFGNRDAKNTTASYLENCMHKTIIPDKNFEQALIDLGYDSGELDGTVITHNVSIIADLDVSSKSISDLTGIKDFVALTGFNCSDNDLKTVDISSNTALEVFYCHNNQLTALNISKNVALEYLWCYDNQLKSLNTASNPLLTVLSCGFNALTNLDLSGNTILTELYCNDNQLTRLNLSNGQNDALIAFNVANNKNLGCIKVDNIDLITDKFGSSDAEDVTANYLENCEHKTIIPDENFEKALIDLGYDSGEVDGIVSTNNISSVTYLDVSNKSISDLTGIQNFVALKTLRCDYNQLTGIDISSNTILTVLSCNYNQLKILDVSNNSALLSLSCNDNRLTSLDISKNTALKILHCNHNQLTSLDVATNTALKHLDCASNQLTSLDVAINPVLTKLYCYNNQLTDLDISKNLFLETLHCKNNQLTSLDISKNVALTGLYFSENQLTSLDVSKNTALEFISCYNNQLTSLDISKNTALAKLYCDDNQLTSLNISRNAYLKTLHCNYNQLTSLDISNNQSLTELYCQENDLRNLNLKNENNGKLQMFNAKNNPNLDCIEVSSVETMETMFDDGYSPTKTSVGYKENCSYALREQYSIMAQTDLNVIDNKVVVNSPQPNIEVYRLSGQKVKNQNLSSGIYMVKITDKNLVIVKKALVK